MIQAPESPPTVKNWPSARGKGMTKTSVGEESSDESKSKNGSSTSETADDLPAVRERSPSGHLDQTHGR